MRRLNTIVFDVYGREGCSFCLKAIELLNKDRVFKKYGMEVRTCYHNIVQEGLSKDDLTEIMGKPVTTVPQILVDGLPLGGFSELKYYVVNSLGIDIYSEEFENNGSEILDLSGLELADKELDSDKE